MTSKEAQLLGFLRKKGGLASFSEISKAGFNKALLKNTLTSKRISRIDRGLYRLSEGVSFSHPDLVAVSIKVPRGVVCLLSSLAFHEVTTEIPKYVEVAIPRGSHASRMKYPPVKFYRFSSKVWEVGIETRNMEGRKVRIYNLAKTVADCFKFRSQIGSDVAREALKAAVTEKRIPPREIMHYAKVCRVDGLIKPLLENML